MHAVRLVLALAVPGLLNGVSACGSNCSAMGCIPGVTVALDEPIVEPGEYRVTAIADGREMTCTTTVPPVGTDDCTDTRLSVFGRGRETRDGDSVSEGAAMNLAGIIVLGEPERIELRIESGDATLAEATIDPDYEGVEINGPGCGKCMQASETMAVTPP